MVKNRQNRPLKSRRDMRKKMDEKVEIFGVTINGTREDRVLKKLFSQRKELMHAVTVNSEYMMEARKNKNFKKVLASAEVAVADGWGVVWGVKLLLGREIERISGEKLVIEILKRASEKQERVFLLGAGQGVAERAARMMGKEYPSAEYAWFEGAKTVRLEQQEEASMTVAKINAFEPDYLLVAYGSPWQDIWIEENRRYLRARVAIGVGGVLDEWAGVAKRCPKWLDRVGGKWLWRWMTEPRRTWRMLRVLKFAGLVMYHKLID